MSELIASEPQIESQFEPQIESQIEPQIESQMESLDQLLSQKVEIENIGELQIGQTITIAGWIHIMRWQKKLLFAKINDSATTRLKPLQVIFEVTKEPVKGYYTQLQSICKGTSIIIKGLIVKSPGSEQQIEMLCQQYLIIGHVDDPIHYPLAGTHSENVEHLRDWPELECFSQVKSTIYDIRTGLEEAIVLFFKQEKYRKVDLPVITFSECEGGCQPLQATLFLTDNNKSSISTKLTANNEQTDCIDFSKDFFGAKASLTVSAQLELETRLPLGNVWTMTRAFRGEPSQTTKHLCEFSMIEFEKRFSRSGVDIMDISETLIKFCIQYVLDKYETHLDFLQKFYKNDHITKLQQYLSTPFIRITHAQAVTLMLDQVSNKSVEFNELPAYDKDLGSEHEKYLTDTFYQLPVIVAKYPEMVKAFYMPQINETPEESHGVAHVDCFDILVPSVGELVGGSQRIYKTDELIARIMERGLDMEPLQFYINLRKYGSVPHGGAGIGFERLIKFITGAENVKDCVAFPRFMNCGK